MIGIILETDFVLQSLGIIGIVIFYTVLAKLSALMGKGMRLPPYYLWYYVASLITSFTIPIHLFLHQRYETPHSLEYVIDLQGIYFSLLLLSNIIVLIVSFKYWWWLKDELLNRNRLKNRLRFVK